MSEWQAFEGAVEPLVWGRATYTILRVPAEVAATFRAAGAARVEGEIAEHPVNLALSRAPVVEGSFLWAGQSLLDRIGIVPGDRIEVRLRPARSDVVDIPDDLAAALRSADRTAGWQALTLGRRRGLIYRIASAKTAATRSRRIAEVIEGLAP
jgi:Bacteriocin-protection, YdeI or OmpD-Associated/Domain of unknown function (DUF1905)